MRRVGRPTRWSEWLTAAKVRNVDTGHGMHIDDGHLVLQAAAAGSGVALGRLVYALDDLDARRLRMPFGPVLDLDVQYYLFVPEARANEPAITAVRAWLVQEAESFVKRLREFIGATSAAAAAGRASR
jgi:DNA-binding transcriptional LysR family regulator